ncbi:MAG TPA: Ig-like domain-containing protein, partial [Acidimicrobiia bacterium]|nr:Ig-like domain-containing protein [Acidimicrobiia bacterium]
MTGQPGDQGDIVVDFPRRQLSLPRPPWWGLATVATMAAALLLPLAAGSGPRSDTQIRLSSSSEAFRPAMAPLPGGNLVVVWQGPASPPLETTTTTRPLPAQEFLGSKPAQTEEETTTTTTGEETAPTTGEETTTSTGEETTTTTTTEETTITTAEETTTTTAAEETTTTTAAEESTTTTAAEETTTTTVAQETTTTTAEETTTTTEAPTTTTTTRPSLPGEGIFARIGASDGGDLGAEIKVSDWGTNPAVAADASGNFLVAWEQDGDIFTRLFDAAGNSTRDALLLNLSTAGPQTDPAVAAVPNFTNQFAVAFAGAGVEDTEKLRSVARTGNASDDAGIWLRYTGASGNEPVQTLVNAQSTTGPQGHPSILSTAFDAVTVVWDGTGPDDEAGVFGARDVRRANFAVAGASIANGTPPAAVKRLSPAVGTQSDPEVARVGSAQLVVWSGEGPEDPAGIWAAPFDNTDRTPVLVNGFTDGEQSHPAVAGTQGNIVTVAWDGPGPDDPNGISARRFDITANSGRPLSPQFRVNTPADGTQSRPALARTATGRYTVVFDGMGGGEDRAVFARSYNVNDPPQVVDDAYTVGEDTILSADGLDGRPAGVLANDTEPDGDSMTAALAVPPEHGTLELKPDGTFTFVPEGNYNGVVT